MALKTSTMMFRGHFVWLSYNSDCYTKLDKHISGFDTVQRWEKHKDQKHLISIHVKNWNIPFFASHLPITTCLWQNTSTSYWLWRDVFVRPCVEWWGLDLKTASDEWGLTTAAQLHTIFQRSSETLQTVSKSVRLGVRRSVVWYIMGGRCNKSYDTKNSSSRYFSAEQTAQCFLQCQRWVTYINGLGKCSNTVVC